MAQMSFFCACTVVFAALTKRRMNARLGAINAAAAQNDTDVMTVNATFSGFQVLPNGSVAPQGGGGGGLVSSLLSSPVVVTGQCDDSLGPEDITPGLGKRP